MTARAPAPAPAPAPAWRAILVLTAFELRLAARRGENLLVTLVIPVAVLLFFSSVSVLPVGDRPVDVLLPASIALGIVAASFVNLGITTAYERHYGVLKRLGGAPVPRGAVVVAKVLAVLVLEAVQVAALVAIAWLALGWRPAGPVSAPALAAAVALGTAAFAGLGLAIAGRLRPEATLAVANGVFVALVLVGGIIVPVDRLPAPLGTVAAILPSAALADLLRTALGGPAASPLPAVAVLGAWAVGSIALALRWFRWE